MSDVIAVHLENFPPDHPVSDTPPEMIETVVEETRWEPRRVHVPRPLIWGVLITFILAILAMGVWGLAQSTWTYGMTPVDSTTTERLGQIYRELLYAGVPETSLHHLEIAARPGVNIGDAIEALVDADKDLDKLSSNPVVVSARGELRGILSSLKVGRYGGQVYPSPTPRITDTPLPTLAFPTPQP